MMRSIANALQGLPAKAAPTIPRMQRSLPTRIAIPNVKHVVVVASGKGGVGKSTTAVNLAVASSRLGKRVGLLDADIFGPSIPRMMNLSGEPEIRDDMMMPLINYGVKCMSMGFLVKEENAVVWRGLMVMKALEQLIRRVSWGALDLLVIDMPPGTGDTQLTITQQLPLSVSTPQDVALADAIKGVQMFKKVDVPILGMVQNMSIFKCPNCGVCTHVFGQDGVLSKAAEMQLDILCDIPLHADVCKTSDEGTPITICAPDGPHALAYIALAKNVWKKLDKGISKT